MLKTPHHATVKKAEKSGVILRALEDGSAYEALWAEGNLRSTSPDAKVALEQVLLLRMIKAEYPKLKVEFAKGEWIVKQGRKVLARNIDLAEAWYQASEAMAPKVEAKQKDLFEDAPKAKSPKGRKATQIMDDDDEDDAHDQDEIDDDMADEGEEEAEDSKSIVKPKYRAKYKPTHNTCGDDLAQRISDFVSYEDPETGKRAVDQPALKAFAEANDCWQPKYKSLNPGQQRMNVGNRLRAKLRKDPKFKIKWAKDA